MPAPISALTVRSVVARAAIRKRQVAQAARVDVPQQHLSSRRESLLLTSGAAAGVLLTPTPFARAETPSQGITENWSSRLDFGPSLIVCQHNFSVDA